MMLARSILFIVFQAWSASCKDVVSNLFPVDQLFFKLALTSSQNVSAFSYVVPIKKNLE